MAKIRRLAKPPIVEALIDVQFAVEKHISDEQLLAFADSLTPEGFKHQELRTFAATLGPIEGAKSLGISEASTKSDGYMIQSPDSPHILQVRKDRVTVSQTRDYQSWEILLRAFEPAFIGALEHLKPTKVIRVAARYINRLNFQEDRPTLEDYLNAAPRVAGYPDASFLQFKEQVIMNAYDGFLVAVNTGNAVDGHAFVVDVDVFRKLDQEPTLAATFASLEIAHSLKNEVFFAAVSEKSLEPYV